MSKYNLKKKISKYLYIIMEIDKTVQNMINATDTESVKMLSWMYKHPWVKTLILVILGLYIVLSPKIPKIVVRLYASKIFKLLVVLLILFLSAHDVQLAVMMSIVYLLTVHRITCGNEYFTASGDSMGSPPPGGMGSPPPPGGGMGSPPHGGMGSPPPGGGMGSPPPGGGYMGGGGMGSPPPGGGMGSPPPHGGMGSPPPHGGMGSPPPGCPAQCMGPPQRGTVAVGDDTKAQRFAPV